MAEMLDMASRGLEQMQNNADLLGPTFSFLDCLITGFFRDELNLGRASTSGISLFVFHGHLANKLLDDLCCLPHRK